MTLQVGSYGGGVQSTAMLVLAVQGKISHRTFLFCNVGDDSENPETIAYVRDVAIPYAEANGIDLVTLDTTLRTGETDTILKRLERQERTVHIPMRMMNGAPGNRSCTYDFKIKQVAKWTKQHGATVDNPAHVALGISIDEYQRMKTSTIPHQISDYPLIDMRLTREDCRRIISEAGLPVPPKSSCFFCPFQTIPQWRSLKRKRPDLFQNAVDIEKMVIEKRAGMGKDAMWMTAAGKPLEEVVDDGQLDLFDDDATCDIGGYCMS